MECMASTFLVLPKVIQNLVQVSDEVKYFDELERTYTMVFYVPKYKVVLFATLIPTWDKFNDVVECMASMFLVLPKVIQNLVQVSDARSRIPQHLKTQDQVFSDQGTMMQDVQRYSYPNDAGQWWENSDKRGKEDKLDKS